jgi:TonB family protein
MPARGLLIAVLLLTVSPQTQPRFPIHVESLVYPALSRQARIQGDVVLVAQIGSDGRVPSPIGRSGHPMFVQAAQDNLKKWKFRSGEYQEMEITYHFKLIEPSSDSAQTECVFDLPDSVTVYAHAPVPPVNYSSPTGSPSPQ